MISSKMFQLYSKCKIVYEGEFADEGNMINGCLCVHFQLSLIKSFLETFDLEVDSLFDNLKWAITILEISFGKQILGRMWTVPFSSIVFVIDVGIKLQQNNVIQWKRTLRVIQIIKIAGHKSCQGSS